MYLGHSYPHSPSNSQDIPAHLLHFISTFPHFNNPPGLITAVPMHLGVWSSPGDTYHGYAA